MASVSSQFVIGADSNRHGTAWFPGLNGGAERTPVLKLSRDAIRVTRAMTTDALRGTPRAFDPRAALDQLLLDLCAFRGEQELVLALRAHHRLADENLRAGHRFVGFEALRHLLRERNIERVTLDRRAVCATCGSYGSESSRMLPWGGAREGAGSEGRVACAVCGKPPVTSEPPGAVEKHSHPDAFAFRIGEAFDASALRRHELVSLHHDPCVRVLGSRSRRRIDRDCA